MAYLIRSLPESFALLAIVSHAFNEYVGRFEAAIKAEVDRRKKS